MTAFNGATVEQTVVKCPDLACVHLLEKEALASPVCTRIREWVLRILPRYTDYELLFGPLILIGRNLKISDIYTIKMILHKLCSK